MRSKQQQSDKYIEGSQQKIAQGRDGSVYLSLDKSCVTKSFKSPNKCRKEAEALTALRDTGFVPKLVAHTAHSLTMEYIPGISLDEYVQFMNCRKQKAPAELENCLLHIHQTLDEKNINPNDFNVRNYIVSNDKIYRIDFATWKRGKTLCEVFVKNVYTVFPVFTRHVLSRMDEDPTRYKVLLESPLFTVMKEQVGWIDSQT